MSLGLRLLGLSLGNSGGGSAAPVFPQPTNREAMFYGDSRIAYGGGLAAAPTIPPAAATNSVLTTSGMQAFITPYTNGRVRPAAVCTFGYPGAQIESICDVSRLSLVAANSANILVVLMGTNNAANNSASIAPGGAARTIFDAMIDVLTNPSSTKWSAIPNATGPIALYNNEPKRIIVLNELPRGVKPDGTNLNNLSAANAAILKNFGIWAAGYAYNSGLSTANPYVAAADSYATLYDVSSGTNYYNIAGGLYDGLHPQAPGTQLITQAVASVVNSWLDTSVNYLPLPTTTTISTYLNSANNGLFLTQTGGTIQASAGIVTGTAPSGWTLSGSNATPLSVAITYEALPTGQGYAVVLTVSGTAIASGFIQLKGGFDASKIVMGTDKIALVASMAYSVPSGTSVTAFQLLSFQNTANAIYGYTAATMQPGQTGSLLNNGLDSSEGYTSVLTPPLDFRNAGSTTAGSNSIQTQINFTAGTVAGTFKIGQIGMFKQ